MTRAYDTRKIFIVRWLSLLVRCGVCDENDTLDLLGHRQFDGRSLQTVSKTRRNACLIEHKPQPFALL